MPLVSIIMPVYNAESTLNRAIESVLNQTNGDWELICVDDGSEDNSYKILETYSQNDRRIKSYHKNNSGPGLTRNFAFLKATGEYFAFLDSDDWYENDFVELVNEKVKSDNPDLIFYDLVCEKTNGEKIRSVQISKSKNISKKDLLKFQMTGKIEWGMVKVIKKRIIIDNNLKFSDDQVGEEAIFSFSVLNCASTVAFIDKTIYHYTLITDGQHQKGGDDPWSPVVSKMKEHLFSINEYENYQTTINSFALKALLIACYRLSVKNSYKVARDEMLAKIDKYAQEYDLSNIEKTVLDRSLLILYPFIKRRKVFFVFLVSRIRKIGR